MKKLVTIIRPGRRSCLVLVATAAASSCALAQGVPTTVSADRPGISVLAPAQSFPLAPDSTGGSVPERALDAIDDDPLVAQPDAQPPVDAADLLYRSGVDGGRADRDPGAGLRLRASPETPARLGPAAVPPAWLAGVGNFTRHQGDLASVTIGQVADPATFWGATPRLGGVQLARLPTQTSRGTLLPGAFGMSTTLGLTAMQDMSGPTPSKRLAFGLPVGTSRFMYGLTPDLTIESRMLAGPEHTSAGFGGTYALSDWGTVRLGATQTQEADAPALSSGLGMQVRWEDHALESTYQSLRTGGITTGQRIGVTHHWAVSRDLGLQMGADRDLASGSYAVRLQISVPIDAVGIFWSR